MESFLFPRVVQIKKPMNEGLHITFSLLQDFQQGSSTATFRMLMVRLASKGYTAYGMYVISHVQLRQDFEEFSNSERS